MAIPQTERYRQIKLLRKTQAKCTPPLLIALEKSYPIIRSFVWPWPCHVFNFPGLKHSLSAAAPSACQCLLFPLLLYTTWPSSFPWTCLFKSTTHYLHHLIRPDHWITQTAYLARLCSELLCTRPICLPGTCRCSLIPQESLQNLQLHLPQLDFFFLTIEYKKTPWV